MTRDNFNMLSTWLVVPIVGIAIVGSNADLSVDAHVALIALQTFLLGVQITSLVASYMKER